MTDFFDGETFEPEVTTTPNIEFQLCKFSEDEPLFQKCISEKALFATSSTISKIKSFYESNIDNPILICGAQGTGKLTSIIGLIKYIPCYLPDYNIDDINKKLNNLHYFKILDANFNKILFYENCYYINLEILNNNNEVIEYLKYIYQIAKSSNIKNFDNINNDAYDDVFGKVIIDNDNYSSNNNCSNDNCSNDNCSSNYNYNNNNNNNKIDKKIDKKIIIITHIDKCNKEAQRYIAFMLEKMNIYISYILTSYNTNSIDKKIISLCSPIYFNNLDETEFIKIFKINFKFSFEKKNYILNTSTLKQFYQIYVSNRYNIGNTISQIKYYLEIEGIEFLKNKDNKISLLSQIADNFIKKKLILSNVSSALEIRKFLYILLSLNIKLIIFVKEVVNQLSNSKLNSNIKMKIIEKASIISYELNNSNKEVVIIELFFYDIITIMYS
jgi:hypothetical protein